MKVKTEYLIKKTNAEGSKPEVDNIHYKISPKTINIFYIHKFNVEYCLIWFQDLTFSAKKRKQFDSF